MFRAAVIGFITGILADAALWFGISALPADSVLVKFLETISYPVACIISWLTDWRLQAEEEILIYVFAIPISVPLFTMLLAMLFTVIVRQLKSPHANRSR